MQVASVLSGAPENTKDPKRVSPHQCLPPSIFHQEQQDVRPQKSTVNTHGGISGTQPETLNDGFSRVTQLQGNWSTVVSGMSKRWANCN